MSDYTDRYVSIDGWNLSSVFSGKLLQELLEGIAAEAETMSDDIKPS